MSTRDEREKPWIIRLDVGERYPFVRETETGGVEVRFGDPDTITRWRQVMAQFEVVQDEMEAAYDEAQRAEKAAREVAAAEAEVQRAQARLEEIRYEQEHPPEDPLSWPSPGDFSCVGPSYEHSNLASRARVEVYDKVSARGKTMTFDIAPYRCVDGHWHLGRVTDA